LFRTSLICPLIISVLLLAVMLLPATWQALLEYQLGAIGEGEVWRFIGGHLVHLGWGHLLMNLLGFWLIWELFLSNRMPAEICLFGLTLLTLCVSLGLYLLSPDIEWYRGFSGVLHGLLVWALLRELHLHPLSSGLILALVVVKLLLEQYFGALPGSESLAKGRVIVDAHLYGGLAGALVWGLEKRFPKFKKTEVTE